MRGKLLVAVAAGVVAVLGGLAVNPATSQADWPGPLDWLRRYAWAAVGALSVLGVLLAAVTTWLQERTASAAGPPPPPVPEVPDWVVDRSERDVAVAAVCGRGTAVGITTALEGAGGFGKTVLAGAVCAHRRVRRRFRGRIHVVTMGRDVRGPVAVAAKVAEATRFITGDTATFDDPALAGAHLGRLLDARPRTLLVLDDVWEHEQLAPFLLGGHRCVRLVTTRIPGVLPHTARCVRVDEMSPAQARHVLTWELPPLPGDLVDALVRVTGRWALLLRLTNRLVKEQTDTGADAAAAARRVLSRLREGGPGAVDEEFRPPDMDSPARRSTAVRATVEAAVERLPEGGRERFVELAVFVEDEAVPLALVGALWRATAGLTEEDTRTLCGTLARLSLLTLAPDNGGTIALHDVLRDYLRGEVGDEAALAALHGTLVDAVAQDLPPAGPLAPSCPDPGAAWWETRQGYLLDHLIEHLVGAARTERALAVAGDLRWIEARLVQRGATAPWRDLTAVPTAEAAARARELGSVAHLLDLAAPVHAVANVLHSRLAPLPAWQAQVAARQRAADGPVLVNHWPLPDVPSPALLRTFIGHRGPVNAVALAPGGRWAASGGDDGKVRLWDPATGVCLRILDHNHYTYVGLEPTELVRPVTALAIAPSGRWLAAGGEDGMAVWDTTTGTRLGHHAGPVTSVAVAPDSRWLVTGDGGPRVHVWNASTGSRVNVLETGGPWVTAVAVTPDGRRVLAGGHDGVLRSWQPPDGSADGWLTPWPDPPLATERDGGSAGAGPASRIVSLAVGRDDRVAAVAADGRAWAWGATVDERPFPVDTDDARCLALAPDGRLVVGCGAGRVLVAERATGAVTRVLEGHVGRVNAVAAAPDGTWLVGAGDDGKVCLWDSGPETGAGSGQHRGSADAVAVEPGGRWAVTAGARGVSVRELATGVPVWSNTAPATHLAAAGDRFVVAHVNGVLGTARWGGDREDTGLLPPPSRPVPHRALALSPDGGRLAVVEADGTVRVCGVPSREPDTSFVAGAGRVTAVAFAPDASWLAWGGSHGAVHVSAGNGGDGGDDPWPRVGGVGARTEVHALAVAPDGSWLATADGRGSVQLWDVASGARTGVLDGHDGAVHALAAAPSGAWLASAGADGTLRVWRVPGGDPVTLVRVDGRLRSCAWGPDSRLLLAAGERGVYAYELRP